MISTAKLMGMMPAVMSALNSENFKALLPQAMELIDDKLLDGIRTGMVEFMQKKCTPLVRYSVVFEPSEDLAGLHMRVWKTTLPDSPDGKAIQSLMLDVPFAEVKAEDLKALLKPIFEQATIETNG